MAEDWLADVRRYAPDADEGVVGSIVEHCGIALRSRDSSLVSFSDEVEVARVRENFLRKTLRLTGPDRLLSDGIALVEHLMVGDRTKNRVTVYYLLAHYFGKLDHFGGQNGTSAASLDGAAALASAASSAAAKPALPKALMGRADSSSAANVTRPQFTVLESGRKLRAGPVSSGASISRSSNASWGDVISDAAVLRDLQESSGFPRWLTWPVYALSIFALLFLMRSCVALSASVTEREPGLRGAQATFQVDASGNAVGSRASGTTPNRLFRLAAV
ncbi:MAG: DUF2853 family protein [Rhizobiaceae bacterium]|nr:MAG: DUF2853 family protein [Rhizobiaceae bacterium]